MLCIDGVVCMLDMWCCVHKVLCACFICGVVCMWCRVQVVHGVLCVGGPVYM